MGRHLRAKRSSRYQGKGEEMRKWGTPVEVERRRRIMVAAAAWAYERHSDPIMTDEEFDRECAAIDLTVDTGNAAMDAWFRANFSPHTGQWVNSHPNKAGLERIYQNAVERRGNA